MERFIAGTSEKIQAEFGVMQTISELPYMFVSFYDSEIQCLDMFESKEAMKAFLKEWDVPSVEYFL